MHTALIGEYIKFNNALSTAVRKKVTEQLCLADLTHTHVICKRICIRIGLSYHSRVAIVTGLAILTLKQVR